MAEYIEREALKQYLLGKGFYPAIVKGALESLPTADVVDVRHGLTSIAYVLHEHGFEGQKVLKILKDIEEVADNMVEDYIAFNDIRKVLKDEYGFEIQMKG